MTLSAPCLITTAQPESRWQPWDCGQMAPGAWRAGPRLRERAAGRPRLIH